MGKDKFRVKYRRVNILVMFLVILIFILILYLVSQMIANYIPYSLEVLVATEFLLLGLLFFRENKYENKLLLDDEYVKSFDERSFMINSKALSILTVYYFVSLVLIVVLSLIFSFSVLSLILILLLNIVASLLVRILCVIYYKRKC